VRPDIPLSSGINYDGSFCPSTAAISAVRMAFQTAVIDFLTDVIWRGGMMNAPPYQPSGGQAEG